MSARSTSSRLNHSLNMAGLNRLPSFPMVIVKILDALQDDRMDVSRLAVLIEMDAVLTARLLSTANSPFYSYGSTILSIEQAINNLGWGMVKMLALSAAMMRILNDFSHAKHLNLTRFWHHSLYAAVISRQLAGSIPAISQDEAYLSGLLHDIGRLALRVNFGNEYQHIFDSYAAEESLLAEEQRHFGFNHSDIGAWLVEDWEIKSFLQDAIAFHHLPTEQLMHATTLVKITQLAASISESYPLVLSIDIANAKRWFNIMPPELESLIKLASAQVQALAATLNIDIGPLKKLAASQHVLLMQNTQEIGELQEKAEPLAESIISVDFDSTSVYQSVIQSALIDHVAKVIDINQDLAAFQSTLAQVAWILCGAQHVLVFMVDQVQRTLIGKKMHLEQDWVEQFSFPIEAGASLMSDAFMQQTHVASHTYQTEDLNAAERQLMRLCHAEGMLCVPMRLAETQVGVMVFALDKLAAQDLLGKLYLAHSLARSAASYFTMEATLVAVNDDVELSQPSQQELEKFIHETSNPLSTVKNYLEILRRKLISNPSIDRDLRIVNEEINRVSLLISQLEEANSSDSAQLVMVDINRAIEDVVVLHETTYLKPRRITTTHILSDNVPQIMCVPYKLKQILINLVKNAAEAMPEGGQLTIKSFTEYLPNNKKWIVITVTDTGVGIDDNVRDMIFSTMKTTKGQTNKGLGLSIVAELVTSLQGEISFRTAQNMGTSFEIRLPFEHD